MSSPDKPDEPQAPVEPPSSESSEPGSATPNVDAFYGVPASPQTTMMEAVVPEAATEGGTQAFGTSPEAPGAEGGTQPFGAPPDPTAPPSVLVDSDAPPLPALAPDAELRDAVGAPKRAKKRLATAPTDDDGEDGEKKLSRKTMMISAAAIVVGLGIATLVFLGRANSQRYVIACTTDHVSAQQGRSFPPWGTRPLSGAEWKAIPLAPNAECTPRETENIGDLEGWYLDLLVERASTTLTSPDLIDGTATPGSTTAKGQPVATLSPLDEVAAQLNQALLLSRAPERRDQRKEVERLLGDVQYWHASLRLREAAAGLLDASHQFDAAAAQRPRHVTDAAAWGAFLRKLSDELQAGPNGAPAAAEGPEPVPSERPVAPAGVALPVEPAPAEPSSSDSVPPTPDAGVPSGGVLL